MIDRFRRFTQPATVDEAVQLLISDLNPQQMAAVADLGDDEFDRLCRRLVPHLQYDFRLWNGNDALLLSCFEQVDFNTGTDPMRIIMDRMRALLQSHQDVIIVD